jgi:glutaredoxin
MDTNQPDHLTVGLGPNIYKAVVWSKENCTFCDQAKQLLDSKRIQYTEKKIGEGFTREQLLEEVPNARSVPQIFLAGEYVGGFPELKEYLVKNGF